MKLALASVSYLGVWYKGPASTLEEVFLLARQAGYDGVEINCKRPHGCPLDFSAKRRAELRAFADGEGLSFPAVSANNDLTSPVPDQLEVQMVMVADLLQLAADLGSPVVRVFLGWPGVQMPEDRTNGIGQYESALRHWEHGVQGSSRLEIWQRARGALSELAAIASDLGVVLALQNHAPVVRGYRDVLDMVSEVDSPGLKVCLDAPLMSDQSDEAIARAVEETGDLLVHSHVLAEFERAPDGSLAQQPLDIGLPAASFNYPAFVRSLAAAGYDGALSYEFCHPALNKRHELQGREYVDAQVERAREYFAKLVVEATAPTPAGGGR